MTITDLMSEQHVHTRDETRWPAPQIPTDPETYRELRSAAVALVAWHAEVLALSACPSSTRRSERNPNHDHHP